MTPIPGKSAPTLVYLSLVGASLLAMMAVQAKEIPADQVKRTLYCFATEQTDHNVFEL